MMAAAMRLATNVRRPTNERAPVNQFAHLSHFPDPALQAIVGANPDTLYSLAWLDLSAGPMLLELPDTAGRSYLMPLVDAWSNLIACLGPRTAGTSGGTYALTGPGWEGVLPVGASRVDAPTNTVWAIGHLHAAGSDDLERGRTIQRGFTLTPLSAHGAAYLAPDGVVQTALESKPRPRPLLGKMGAEEFLFDLAAEMGDNPPGHRDLPFLDRLATIGVRPGRTFSWIGLPGETRDALELGLAEGRTAAGSPPPRHMENGWETSSERLGDDDTDYLHRAQTANIALGAVDPTDADFPLTAMDGAGRRTNGKHRYVVRFEAGDLPPVGALWSLALYDTDQLLVDNAIDRYALGDRDELEIAPDGSLEIAIQHDRPSGSDANWLPAPEDDFSLMMHMYWPSQRALDGSWTIPPVQRVAH